MCRVCFCVKNQKSLLWKIISALDTIHKFTVEYNFNLSFETFLLVESSHYFHSRIIFSIRKHQFSFLRKKIYFIKNEYSLRSCCLTFYLNYCYDTNIKSALVQNFFFYKKCFHNNEFPMVFSF